MLTSTVNDSILKKKDYLLGDLTKLRSKDWKLGVPSVLHKALNGMTWLPTLSLKQREGRVAGSVGHSASTMPRGWSAYLRRHLLDK